MREDERFLDRVYSNKEGKRANGILFLFVFWMIGFHPLLVIYTQAPVLDSIQDIMLRLGYAGGGVIYFAGMVLMGSFALLGIFLGFRIFKLEKKAWKILKIYLIVKIIFEVLIILFNYLLIVKVNELGLFTKHEYSFNKLSSDLILRLISNIVIFCIWFIYMVRSRKINGGRSLRKLIDHKGLHTFTESLFVNAVFKGL